MSVANSMIITPTTDTLSTSNLNGSQKVIQEPEQVLRCFVCDAKVEGRRYALATCKTQASRSRIIEKLGELVGERYIVVISEDDVICRSCANLMNTLDRLESETKVVKSAVLRFLECKYSLAEGELMGGTGVEKPCQPPQIMRSDSQTAAYYTRKRGPVTMDDGNATKKNKKTSVWMQCDKCRYTTLYNTYMVHHIRQHNKQKIRCDKCGVQFAGPKSLTHFCKNGEEKNRTVEMQNFDNEPQPVEPTANISTSEATGTISNVVAEGKLPILTMQPNLKLPGNSKDEQIHLINVNVSNPSSRQLPNFLTNEGPSRTGEQRLLMRVLQQLGVSEDLSVDQSSSIPVSTPEGGMMIAKGKNPTAKQMLTLAEDGSLEMVTVDNWDDVNTSEPDPDDISF